jgi:hypothetical protein
MWVAPSVLIALPGLAANAATTASMPSRLVPDITPAYSSRRAGMALRRHGTGGAVR